MNTEIYCEALNIKDPCNMNAEEAKRWEKLMSLSPTARGYVVKASEQGVDILYCYSKENLYQRYNSHFDILTVSEFLGLHPKKVILKGHEANYYTAKDVDTLDEFFKKHSAKEIRKIVTEQTSLKKYGVISYKQTAEYRSKVSTIMKNNWQTGSRKYSVPEKVKQNWNSKSQKEKHLKRQHIKEAMLVGKRKAHENLLAQKSLLEEQVKEPLIYLSEACRQLGIGWDALKNTKSQLGFVPEVFQISNYKFLKKSDVDKIFDKFRELAGRSVEEHELATFIGKIYQGKLIVNNRTVLKGRELDVYLPDKQLAFEFNGLYWHSDGRFCSKEEPVPDEETRYNVSQLHLEKTKACEEKGVRLIHVFEDDWILRNDIVKSIIRAALGQFENRVFARKCILRELSVSEYRSFLENNHLQGYSYADIRLGLFFNNELQECIGVHTQGTHDNKLPELVRLCTKQNTQVLGGFGKLLKACNLPKICSYIDRGTFAGNGYRAVGFTIEKINNPTYFYVKGLRRFPRYNFTRKRIERLFNKGQLKYWNPEETEEINMYKNGYSRIWNCGTAKVVWSRV